MAWGPRKAKPVFFFNDGSYYKYTANHNLSSIYIKSYTPCCCGMFQGANYILGLKG